MKVKSGKKVAAAIPTGSMADIAFLLIIFFMVTTVHEVDRTSVNTPPSMFADKAEQGAAIVVMSPDEAGNLIYKFSDGENMSTVVSGPQDIYLEASRIMYAWRDAPLIQQPQFMIKADADLKFELVDELLDELRKAGVQKVLLLSTPSKV